MHIISHFRSSNLVFSLFREFLESRNSKLIGKNNPFARLYSYSNNLLS